MSQWIETLSGAKFNLDHAAEMRWSKEGHWLIIGPDGKVVAASEDEACREIANPADLFVPATAGQEALLVSWYDGDETPDIERRHIVAWQLSRLANGDVFAAYPVIAGDSPASNQAVFVLHADGSYEVVTETTLKTLDEVVLYARNRSKPIS